MTAQLSLPTACPAWCTEPPGHGWDSAGPAGCREWQRVCRRAYVEDALGLVVSLCRFQWADADGNVTVTPEVRVGDFGAVPLAQLEALAVGVTEAAGALAAELAVAR